MHIFYLCVLKMKINDPFVVALKIFTAAAWKQTATRIRIRVFSDYTGVRRVIHSEATTWLNQSLELNTQCSLGWCALGFLI
jgi:hypothetical protein